MIITAGNLKGQRVKCPSGKDVRPTSSKTRMGVFNVISSNFSFNSQINLLELFAGTGLFSFEALSRDIDTATLIDKSDNSVSYIRENIKNLKLQNRVELIKMDALSFIKERELDKYNLIFMDPPYSLNICNDILEIISKKINKGTVVIVETNKEFVTENTEIIDYKIVRIKNWGGTIVSFLEKR